MKYEAEYMPDTGELADVVHILKDGRAVEVDVPDDTEDPVDEEGAPEARLAARTPDVPPRSCDGKAGAADREEEEPHVEYD